MTKPIELALRAPVTRVVAFEDRAELTRELSLPLPEGAVQVQLLGLTPLTSEAQLTVRLAELGTEGAAVAQVDDFRLRRRWVAEAPADERPVAALFEAQTLAELEYTDAEARRARAEERRDALRELLNHYQARLSRSVWETNPPAGLPEELGRLEAALSQADAALGQAIVERDQAADLRQQAAQACQAPKDSHLLADLTVRLSVVKAGTATLVVSGIVPCALWRPTHEAHLKDNSVHWTTQGTVWQRTGEDFEQAELVLSTDRPGAGATLPTFGEDRLATREKADRKRVHLAHRNETARRSDLGAVPGVYDGGEARIFRAPHPVRWPSDGRPHRFDLGAFTSAARTQLEALPEVDEHVFLKAELTNPATRPPLLAGPVTLLADGAYIGLGDVPYVGTGETFSLSFGSDDRFQLRLHRYRHQEERMLVRDRVHFVTEVELTYTGATPAEVRVVLRWPISEIASLVVVPSPAWCSEGPPNPDADGHLKLPVNLAPGERKRLSVGFSFDKSGDIVLPDPW